MHLYYIFFFFIFFIKVSQAQTDKLIALGSLYNIELQNSKQVDSILISLKELEKIYFVRFVYVDAIRKYDENGEFWDNTKKKFPSEKIRYNLELSWGGNKYSAAFMEETETGTLDEPMLEERNLKNLNQLCKFIERAIIKIEIPKRNIRTDFSSFTKDTTTSTEKVIVKTIDDLQHLNIYNHQDSLERNYLMALYYFRLAAISKIEDRNEKLDSCKIMLKQAKDFNEKKITHLNLKCQQYRQFSLDDFDYSTVEKWWKSLPASDSTKLLKLLKESGYRQNNINSYDFIFNMATQNIKVLMGNDCNIDIFEYLLSQSAFKVEINCSKLDLSQLQVDKLSLDFKKNKSKPLLIVKKFSPSESKYIRLKEIFDIETVK